MTPLTPRELVCMTIGALVVLFLTAGGWQCRRMCCVAEPEPPGDAPEADHFPHDLVARREAERAERPWRPGLPGPC